MSNDSMSLKTRIETSYDGKGAKEAKKDIENLDKTQQGANKSANKSKQASVSAGQGFAAVGQAASVASSGGLGPLSAALGGLAQQLPALASAAGPIGLVIAAFTAWQSAIDSVIKSGEDLEKNLTSIKLGNLEEGIRRLNESYAELTDKLSEASAEMTRLYNTESAGADAAKRAELAKVELEAAEKRAQLDPKDQFAARRLDLEVAQKKAAIEDAAAKKAMEREQRQISQQSDIARTQYGAASEQRNALSDRAAELMAQQAMIQDRAREKAGKWYRTSAGEEEIWKAANTDLQRIANEMKGVRTEMQAAIKSQEQASAVLANLKSAGDINMINQSTYSTTQAAASQGFSNTSNRIVFDEKEYYQQELEKSRTGMAGLSERESDLRDRVRKEWDQAQKIRRDDKASADRVEKEMEDWRDATAALNKFMSKAAPLMKEMKETAERATEALNNLP